MSYQLYVKITCNRVGYQYFFHLILVAAEQGSKSIDAEKTINGTSATYNMK